MATKKEKWKQQCDHAKEIADDYLRQLDHALAEEDEIREKLATAVAYGNLEPEEARECLRAFHNERFADFDEEVERRARNVEAWSEPKPVDYTPIWE